MSDKELAQHLLALHEQLSEKYARVGDGIYDFCPILWKLYNLAWDVEHNDEHA